MFVFFKRTVGSRPGGKMREKDQLVRHMDMYVREEVLGRYFCVLVTISKQRKQIKHKLKLKDVLLVS